MNNRIRERREGIGLSQADLAEKAEVSRATLSDLETGKADNVSVRTLRKIAAALGCSVSEIFLVD